MAVSKRRTELLHSLTSEQQEFILSYSKEEQAILLDRVQKPLHYSVEDIEDLPVDDQIKRQVMLKLPLLKEQIYQIQKAQNLCGGLTPSTLKL
ncbi:hypothetical protein [Halalkalibacter akibai]|uniref:Uncharacterized protein n=1 Tax=Halalkalibacter akibai (strain ATCC 43226 / DSM 21942 / CIP 109018 / JCM 9157 / 1139) TaxID=1236973 RepID=W4QWR7_HALA3|nr:hypothetical protein [Halalkalibacter akibai]GAE35769.1 hypothetical protein JCM9157_2901 [Halalkalibacter akibai JCM 9157]